MGKPICSTSALFLAFTFCLGSVAGQDAGTTTLAPRKRIVFLGDSLASGHGVRPSEAFPAQVAEKVREANLPYEVDNAGVGGDTSAGGLRRIDWLLQRPVDVLVIELGGNDGLRGLPLETLKSNLQGIIDKARARNPQTRIVIAGMQLPPNLGPGYVEKFQALYPELAARNNAVLIPHLLEGVGGVRNLNQNDLIHPTAAGHKRIAEIVWKTLEPVLKE